MGLPGSVMATQAERFCIQVQVVHGVYGCMLTGICGKVCPPPNMCPTPPERYLNRSINPPSPVVRMTLRPSCCPAG